MSSISGPDAADLLERGLVGTCTTAEAAARIGIRPAALRQRIWKGRVDGVVRIGRAVRIDRAVVEKMAADHAARQGTRARAQRDLATPPDGSAS